MNVLPGLSVSINNSENIIITMVYPTNNDFTIIRSDGESDNRHNLAESDPLYAYYNYDSVYDIIEDIAEEEDEMYVEKQHGSYYLGSAIYVSEYNSILLDVSVLLSTLFRYTINDIQVYLADYSLTNHRGLLPSLHIIQLDIRPNGEYCAIVKTFWLKLVQRCWKKQFAKRQHTIQMRGSIPAQNHFALTGTYPPGLRHIPGLRGMLA